MAIAKYASLILIALYLLITWSKSRKRGGVRSIFRLVGVALSAVVAFVVVTTAKDTIVSADFVNTSLIPALQETEGMEDVVSLLQSSTAIGETVMGLLSALILPITFVVLFVVLCIATAILHAIICIFVSKPKHKGLIVPLAFAVVQTIIVAAVWLTPGAFYAQLVADSADAIEEAGVLEIADENGVPVDLETLKSGNSDPAIAIYKSLGGDQLVTRITSFTVDGEEVIISDEVAVMLELYGDASPLIGSEINQWSEEEADAIKKLGKTFGKSNILGTLVGEVIYQVTDKWQNGEAFMGIEQPDLDGESEQSLMNPFMDSLVAYLHDDAKDSAKLTDDIEAIADMISVLAKNQVLADLADMSDTSELLDKLTGAGEEGEESVVGQMVSALNAHTTGSLCQMTGEITKLGMRAIANTLELAEDMQEQYGGMLDDMADALNSLEGDTVEEKVANLSKALQDSFNDDSTLIPFDESIVDMLAEEMLTEFEGKDSITSEDIEAFFKEVAGTSEDASEEGGEEGGETASANGDIINLGEETKKAVNEELRKFVDGISSPEKMEETSLIITKNKLLNFASEAGLDASALEKEKDAILTIFNEAKTLLEKVGDGDMSSVNLSEITGSVGKIMDALAKTDSFGTEKTADLFVAVMQSKTVTEALGDTMSVKEITEMARNTVSATDEEGNALTVDYEETFGSLGEKAELMNKAEDLTQDDIDEMLADMDPGTARLMASFITEERLTEMFGIEGTVGSQSLAKIVARFSGNILDNMGKKADKEACEGDSKAIQQLYKAALNTKKATLFGEGEDSIFGMTADELLTIMLGSDSIYKAIKVELDTENGGAGANPLGLTGATAEWKTAIQNYYNNSDKTAETKEQLETYWALLSAEALNLQ